MVKNDFINELQKLGLNQDEYIVVGSGILCVLGIRDADDIDLVVSKPVFRNFERTDGWQRKDFDDGSYYLENGIYELGLDWDSQNAEPNLNDLKKNQLIVQGMPFVSLDRLKKWEHKKGRQKDLRDIRLIEQYLKKPAA